MKEHLDLLASVGGNYIRNTMSARDTADVMPFWRGEDGYDLQRWNPEFWQRFENLLRWTNERDIIVQIELWDPWDMLFEPWTRSPWNPANNVNYTFENTALKPEYGDPEQLPSDRTKSVIRQQLSPWQSGIMIDMLNTVPKLANDEVVLAYQHRFVDKVMTHALAYDNVLYCITNEIFKQFSPEWGWYWARYIRKIAETEGKQICVAEMYQWPFLRHEQHKASLDHPEIFDFEDISQNAGRYGMDENHWDNLRYIHRYISDHPRPINHVKTYSSQERHGDVGIPDAREKFLRSIVGGAASIRFHRPPSGIGLSREAQSTIRLVREIEQFVDFWELETHMELLDDRESDEAYLTARPGEAYVLYFTNSGSVQLDLSGHEKAFVARWFSVARGGWESLGEWKYQHPLQGGTPVKVTSPARGGWIVVVAERKIGEEGKA